MVGKKNIRTRENRDTVVFLITRDKRYCRFSVISFSNDFTRILGTILFVPDLVVQQFSSGVQAQFARQRAVGTVHV